MTRVFLKTDELAKATAGGDSFIRTKDKKVKGLALRLDLNPNTPNVVIVGKGKDKERNAKLFVNSGSSAPTYVKRNVNKWEFVGNYYVVDYKTDRETIKFHCTDPNNPDRYIRILDKVAGILLLKPEILEVTEDIILQYPDSETRKKIEKAAIDFVINYLETQGYQIEDKQKENLGYDLLAHSPRGMMQVEVKGTASIQPHFYLTRNEMNSSCHPNWWLAIVSNALKAPKIHFMHGQEMEEGFDFEVLAWSCSLKK